MRGGIRENADKKRRAVSTIRRKIRREGESRLVWTSGERNVASEHKNVVRQVSTHRTHGT